MKNFYRDRERILRASEQDPRVMGGGNRAQCEYIYSYLLSMIHERSIHSFLLGVILSDNRLLAHCGASFGEVVVLLVDVF